MLYLVVVSDSDCWPNLTSMMVAGLNTSKLIPRFISLCAIMLFALVAAPAVSQAVDTEQIKAQVGEMLIVRLPGQPDSGYKWRINTAESLGRDLVLVRELGWTYKEVRGSFTVQHVGILRYTVETKAPGKALLVFEYLRMVPEPPRGRRRMFEIDIAPAALSN